MPQAGLAPRRTWVLRVVQHRQTTAVAVDARDRLQQRLGAARRTALVRHQDTDHRAQPDRDDARHERELHPRPLLSKHAGGARRGSAQCIPRASRTRAHAPTHPRARATRTTRRAAPLCPPASRSPPRTVPPTSHLLTSMIERASAIIKPTNSGDRSAVRGFDDSDTDVRGEKNKNKASDEYRRARAPTSGWR